MTAIAFPATPFVPAAHRWRRWLAPLALVSLLLLAVEGWSPRFRPAEGGSAGAPPPAAAPEADLGAGIEQATHVPTPVPGRPGALEVHDPAYRATFDAAGFSYAPTAAGGALDVSLTSIERGGTPVALAPGAWGAEANAAVREVAPGTTERVTARNREVEWDVVLDTAPAGAGDLTVTADLTGVAGAASHGDGLRVDLSGGGRADLGELVVLDATGAELHRALPRVEGDQLSLEVPASVLDGARYPLTLDPTVSGTQTVTEDDAALRPSVASDGNGYLVVWGSAGEILGARLNASGAVTAAPIPISTSSKYEIYPDVAWNGDSYLVVWQLQFSTSGPTDWDIYGRRLVANGNLIGTPFAIAAPGFDQQLAAVAAGTNTGFFVVWQDNRSGNDVWGQWVSLNGIVDSAPARQLSTSTKQDDQPDVAWVGSSLVVVWQHLYRINPSGPNDVDIVGTRVAPGPGGARFGGELPVSNDVSLQGYPSIASDGSNGLVVWDDLRNGTFDIFGRSVPGSGSMGTIRPIVATGGYQGQPEIAYNGAYLAAWIDDRRGRSEVWATRLNADATSPDAGTNGFLVAATDGAQGHGTPVVSRGSGSEWGVVTSFSKVASSDAGLHLNRVSPK